MSQKVLCIGEVLWDMIPSGRMIGGAPFNVAYHLNRLGVETSMLTRVGNDQDAKDIIDFFQKYAMDTDFVQVDQVQATSRVNVFYDDTNAVKYDIVFPTAWDFLEIPQPADKWKNVDYLVFGSLMFRNLVSRQSMLYILQHSTGQKVFDVNLRQPHYDRDIILDILPHVDILKLNEDELALISQWLRLENYSVENQMDFLMERFTMQEIVLTLGEKGAVHKDKESGQITHCAAKLVKVVDTIGSGDSFLAGFIYSWIMGRDINAAMRFAADLAGYVSSQKGGCPEYDMNDIIFKD